MTDVDLRPPVPPDEPLERAPGGTLGGRDAARRRPRRRVMPAALALILIVAALVLGIVIGFLARGESPPAGLVTEERDVPVVTVTVPQEPQPAP